MKSTLKKYFGYDLFRPGQEEIISSVLKGKDNFVLMPTGGGKSLCYQLPSLLLPGITLVISPLIALMKDQVDSLRENGIPAAFINSSINQEQIKEVVEAVQNKELKLLYIAPERFALDDFQSFLSTIDISLIAIDEAHCISEWGHDFRPDYRNLKNLKKQFPSTPLIALTATATEPVKKDIVNLLNLKNADIFVSSFDRANLQIEVINKKQAFLKLVDILKDFKNESVIIYTHSRKETEELAANLRLNDFSAREYHAGLEANKRKLVQEQFVKDKVDIIVATIAFGMGIDKPDVRLVVHYTFPKTLEGYYQEIGRAGRDGLPSKCVLFYTYADLRRHEYFINQISDPHLFEIANNKLAEVLNFCEHSSCRKKYLLRYFGEEMKQDKCMACDVCLTEREMMDASIIAKKILSAVVRLEGRFGKNHVIDVLLGKNTQRIGINHHDDLSVFGIVKDFSKDELGQITKQLIDHDFLHKSTGKYPTLSITRSGARFLQSDDKLELAKPAREYVQKSKSELVNLEYNSDLFSELRELRKKLADERNVPPFIIFGDKSLMEMSYYFPSSRDEFASIGGVGDKKLNEFGDIFLALIKDFRQRNDIKDQDIPKEKKIATNVKVNFQKPKYHQKTKELLLKKIPIERIAKNQGLKASTIVNHIEKLIDEGEKLDLAYLRLPKDKFEAISQAFIECGDEKLKPVYEHLDAKYEYDDIRLVRVLMRI